MRNRELVQYTVALRNEPGQLHRLAAALAHEHAELLGLAVETVGDVGCARFIAERSPAVRRALADLGLTAFQKPVFVVRAGARTSELERLTRLLGESGVNIETLYATAGEGDHCRLILAVDKPEKAERLLTDFAEGAPLAAR